MLPSVNQLIAEALRLYRMEARVFAGLVSWVLLPYAGVVLLSLQGDDTLFLAGSIVLMAIQLLVSAWAYAAIARIALRRHEGSSIDVAAETQAARGLILPVLIASALVTLTVVGGALLLLVPAIIFYVWFAFAQVIVATGGRKPLEAMTESRELSRGRFAPVAWRLAGGPIAILAIYLLLFLFIATAAELSGVPTILADGQLAPWLEISSSVTEVYLMPLLVGYLVLLFAHLRKDRLAAPAERANVGSN